MSIFKGRCEDVMSYVKCSAQHLTCRKCSAKVPPIITIVIIAIVIFFLLLLKTIILLNTTLSRNHRLY